MSPPLRAVDDNDPGDTMRRPPHNAEAERALLGAILLNNRAFERVSEFLAPGHFADTVNGRIYAACQMFINRGEVANPVTLRGALESDESIIAAGGMKYLGAIVANAVTVINAAEYGRIIYDLYLRREMIALGEDMVNEAYGAIWDAPAVDLIDKAETQLFSLRSDGTSTGELRDFDTVADEALRLAEAAYQHDGALVGVTTGLRGIDKKLGGMHPSDLIIVAGATSAGKTSFVTSIAINAAEYFNTTEREDHRGKQVAFFELEMSAEQLMNRILADKADLDSHAIRSGRLSQEEFTRLVMARGKWRGTPLHIDDSPAASVAQIRSRCRRLARKGRGVGLVIVDYLQLASPGGKERPENRVQEVSAITRGLKALAKELHVPVVALSTLSRAIAAREDKRPMLSDLKESGSIEFDADVVMFVHREQYYLERSEPKQRAGESGEKFHARQLEWTMQLEACHNRGEVIVAKQRHGPIGTVDLAFLPRTTRFSDLHADDDPAEQATLAL
jgi:replicative DNA helicase